MRFLLLALCATTALGADTGTRTKWPPAVAAIDREIASSGVAAEAQDFIPEDWRARVHPLRTVHLDDKCVDLRDINGTPPGAAAQAFMFECQWDSWHAEGEINVLHWVSAATLGEISATPLKYQIWRSDIVLRGDKAFAYFDNVREDTLLASDGNFSTLPPPPPLLGYDWRRQLSPSGRSMLHLVGEHYDEYAVLDTASNEVRFRSKAPGAYYLVHEIAADAFQMIGSGCPGEDPCPPTVMVLDSATQQVHYIPIPDGVNGVPRDYGDRQVIVDVESPGRSGPRGVAIVDLDRLQIVYSGPMPDAPPAKANMCGPLPFEGDSRNLSLPLHVSLDGAGFILRASQRQAATRCAVTGDGRRLAVVALPFIHYYAIDPPH